jgi:hypothetical protein
MMQVLFFLKLIERNNGKEDLAPLLRVKILLPPPL